MVLHRLQPHFIANAPEEQVIGHLDTFSLNLVRQFEELYHGGHCFTRVTIKSWITSYLVAYLRAFLCRQEVADAAKVLEQGDTTPKVLGEEIADVPQNVEAPAPPSTPTKEDSQESQESQDKPGKERRRSESYEKFPLFKVTWDSSVPSLMSRLKSPGKKKRRNSHSTMTERPSVQM